MSKSKNYRKAVAWIAENDSGGADDALDPAGVMNLVSALLVADVFNVEPISVGRDIVALREAAGKGGGT